MKAGIPLQRSPRSESVTNATITPWGTVRIDNRMPTRSTSRSTALVTGFGRRAILDVKVPAGWATTRLVGYEATKFWPIGAPDYFQTVIFDRQPVLTVPSFGIRSGQSGLTARCYRRASVWKAVGARACVRPLAQPTHATGTRTREGCECRSTGRGRGPTRSSSPSRRTAATWACRRA